jgi:hypothetical protein
MTNKHDEEEKRPPETLNEALIVIAYHTGMFAFKVAAIIVAWVVAVELLKSWIM